MHILDDAERRMPVSQNIALDVKFRTIIYNADVYAILRNQPFGQNHGFVIQILQHFETILR